MDEIESPCQEAFDQLSIKLNNKGKDVRGNQNYNVYI